MIPVGPVTTLNRSILLTERRMSGTGGDDFICGHCGSVMLEDFDPSTIRGNPVYQCGVCETTMTYHSPRVMVATGGTSPTLLMVPLSLIVKQPNGSRPIGLTLFPTGGTRQ